MTSASKALDQYFTPPKLAAELIAAVTVDNAVLIADFASGDGELLRAALSRWPTAKCIATDIDSKVVELLNCKHPDWNSSCCDFLSEESREKNDSLKYYKGTIPLITLNPPFSTRGKVLQSVEICGIKARCTSALAFVVTAATYLMPGGQLVAIVPYGLIHSEKDRAVRGLLELHYGFEVVSTYTKGGFSKCRPRTAIIRLVAGASKNESLPSISHSQPVDLANEFVNVSVHRGRLPNNASSHAMADVTSLPFIHTTNLKGHSIHHSSINADASLKSFHGPAILLPRVGRPKLDKVVPIYETNPFILSECVFIIECMNIEETDIVYNTILRKWEKLKSTYGGTCASYLSISELNTFLRGCGFSVLDSGKSVRGIPKLITINIPTKQSKSNNAISINKQSVAI